MGQALLAYTAKILHASDNPIATFEASRMQDHLDPPHRISTVQKLRPNTAGLPDVKASAQAPTRDGTGHRNTTAYINGCHE